MIDPCGWLFAIRPLAVLAVLAFAVPARADEATARAAYKQAEELRKAGKWVDACPLYDASYHDDPQLGVLLHLAECHAKIGRIATAWSEFTDAIELAHKRGDTREAAAKAAADALAPRLSKLHISAPPKLYAGLSVKRDGVDITILVGTDMPIDPGEHAITATAPGYIDSTQKVAIAGEGKIEQLALPELQKVPDKPVVVEPPKVHEGTLTVTTLPEAAITLDTQEVGTGRYEGKLRSGGHTLRVTAKGMRTYQSEIVIADDEHRVVDVPLDKEAGPVAITNPTPVVPIVPRDTGPTFEAGISMAPGVKLRGDNPAALLYRADIGLRIGRRTNLGLWAEYGTISAGGQCGTDIPGPMPMSMYDYGTRNRFDRCFYLMPGLQLYIHILPDSPWDPYIGLTPGFRFGFYDYTPFLNGVPQKQVSEIYPAIYADTRIGVDYHPNGSGWGVGAFAEVDVCTIGDEQNHDQDHKDGRRFVSLFGGLRTSIAW